MKQKMTCWQKAGLIAAGLIPLLWLLMSLILLISGVSVLTLSFAVTYLALPALCLLGLWLTIRSGWKSGVKWVLSFLILVITVLLTMLGMFSGHFSIYDHAEGEDAISMYEEDIGSSNDLMPETADLGEPEHIEYHYFYNQIAIFDSDCYTLICTYTPDNYAAMSAQLDTRYTFHTAPLLAGDAEIPPLYTLDGYEFLFLEMGTDTYPLTFPHYMILVGTNDETYEIVWSYYDDDDLDYIPAPVEFLLEDCGWKFIR